MQTISDDIDFLSYLGDQEGQFVIPASVTADKVIERIRNGVNIVGDPMPWNKTKNCFRYRPGEVTIIGAYNGHKKSMILNQICAWNLEDKRWLIASMEMKPEATMERMVKQVVGYKNPPNEEIKSFLNWTNVRLWIYDQLDTVKYDRILGMVHYAAQVLKINHVIIDSLMKCGFAGSRDNISIQQVEFVNRLCWAAKKYDIHIHLVHHMRKGEGNKSEYNRPGKHDFRGAGDLVDLVDNAIILHQNKRKLEKVEKGENVDQGEPDATLQIVKQRHGEWEGTFNFWFHNDSLQHISEPGRGAMPLSLN